MKNCNQQITADSHSTEHWKKAFEKMLAEALTIMDDPFFPY